MMSQSGPPNKIGLLIRFLAQTDEFNQVVPEALMRTVDAFERTQEMFSADYDTT